MHHSETNQLSTAAISALQNGNKVEAIKIVRQEKGLQLVEAKEAVDQYLKTHPELQKILAARQGQLKKTALFWLTIIAAVILYYFLWDQWKGH